MFNPTLSISRMPLSKRPSSHIASVQFVGLVLFLIAYYSSPEEYVSILGQLPLYKLLAGGAIASVIVNNVRQGKPLVMFSKGTKLTLILVGLMIVNVPFSNWPGGSAEIITGRIVKMILLALLILNVVETERQFKQIMIVMVMSGALIGCYGINSYAKGDVDQWGRIAGYGSKEFGNPNDMALGLLVIIPFAYHLFNREPSFLKRTGYLLALCSLVVGILVSMSRMGMLGLVFLAGVWVYARGRKNLLAAVFTVSVILVGGAMATLSIPTLTERFESIFDQQKDETGSRGFRLQHMQDGLVIMLSNPFFGVGLGQSMDVVAEMHDYTPGHWERIHNAYIEVGADLGIPAMLVFCSIIVVTIRQLSKSEQCMRSSYSGQSAIGAYLTSTRAAMWVFVLAVNFAPGAYNWALFLLVGLSGAIVAIASRYSIESGNSFSGARIEFARTGDSKRGRLTK